MRLFAAMLLAGIAVPALAGPAARPIDTAVTVKAGVDAWTAGDYTGAVKAWQGPAAAGDADAQFNLAQAYKLGRGVPADLTRAEDLYGRAAQQGHLQAGDNYGLLLFQRGQREQALPWIEKSAARGEPRAQYILGIASFNGDIVGKDWVRAYALMTRAAAAGLPQARDGLASMDQLVPMEQRQMGVSLAGELERQAAETRARETAAVDLGSGSGATAPIRRSDPPQPVASVVVPPSSAGETTAGADFANPVVLGDAAPPPPAKPTKRVVGSYISGAPQPAPTSAPAPAASSAPPPVAVHAGVPPIRPAAPRPAPAVAAKPAKTPAPAAATAPTGRYRIQFGAFGNKGNADALWNRLKGKPELSGRSRFDVPAGAVSRLQAGPFASEAEATRACQALVATSGQCLVVRN